MRIATPVPSGRPSAHDDTKRNDKNTQYEKNSGIPGVRKTQERKDGDKRTAEHDQRIESHIARVYRPAYASTITTNSPRAVFFFSRIAATSFGVPTTTSSCIFVSSRPIVTFAFGATFANSVRNFSIRWGDS